MLCASCHGRGYEQACNGVFGFPYDETTQRGYQFGLGEELEEATSGRASPVCTPTASTPGSTVSRAPSSSSPPSPRSMFHHGDAASSAITCTSDNLHHIRETIVEEGANDQEVVIATEIEDNTLCLSCHATHGPVRRSSRKEDIADAEGQP